MGVPSLYRWLVKKYPEIVKNAIEEKGENIDTTGANPNKLEFDNLYLDMNGIIHPCFHPDDQLFPPTTFDEVFDSIFEYIDRLFRIVRPRKLLYMGIDGVAPRAKMNQQRSRRFRTAKDAEIAEVEENRMRKEFEMEGKKVLPKQDSEVSDSTVITPGTIFMDKLSNALQYYIRLRLKNDPGWKNIKVILSDSNVPGEGEHKIMSFIRLQRSLPNYDPNTRHCLYGLDADLIFLALATHEIHFSILREDVLMREQQPDCMVSLETILSRTEYESMKSRGWFGKFLSANGGASLAKKSYQFLHIWTLREYLELELTLDLTIPNPGFVIEFERILDDFIFICFFTGNDFLPHLPSLEIHEGAIDLLMFVYKAKFKNIGGYLTDTRSIKDKKNAYVILNRVEKFILTVGSFEEQIFKKRSILKQRKLQRMLREKFAEVGLDHLDNLDGDSIDEKVATFEISKDISISKQDVICVTPDLREYNSDVLRNTNELMQQLKELLRDKSDLLKNGSTMADKVKLDTPGWKDRYYKEKFFAESSMEIERIRKIITQKYTEGLCWVLQYYFGGVCSWTWFYPFHYGPIVSDLNGLAGSQIKFQMGDPFKPLDQLMGVLPPRSAYMLPKAYGHLLMSEESPIKDLYPDDFEVDMDGKRYMWQGIAKLPFIDEERLISETKKLGDKLTDDEARRNSTTLDMIFFKADHGLRSQICFLYNQYKHLSGEKLTEIKVSIDFQASGGMNGFLCLPNKPIKSMEDIEEDSVISVLYQDPESHEYIPNPNILPNVIMPEKMITEADIEKTQLWHEYEGGNRREINRTQIQQRCTNEEIEKRFVCGRQGWRGRGSSEKSNFVQNSNPFRGTFPRNSNIGQPLNFDFSRGRGSSENLYFGRNSENFMGIEARNGGPGQSWNGLRAIQREHWQHDFRPAASSYSRGQGSSSYHPLALSYSRGRGRGSYENDFRLVAPLYSRGQGRVSYDTRALSYSQARGRGSYEPLATSYSRGRGRGCYDWRSNAKSNPNSSGSDRNRRW